MTILYAYCGLNCAECLSYIATQADDTPAKEKLLTEWRVAYDSPDMDISAVTCNGCTSSGRLGGYCGACAIRACGVQRGVENCAYCPDYGCDKLEAFFAMAPEVRINLEAVRKNIPPR